MYEREIPLEYYTEQGIEPPGLSFTAEDMAEWDEHDVESAKLAMEIDRNERHHAEVYRLEREIDRLRDLLTDYGHEEVSDDDEN